MKLSFLLLFTLISFFGFSQISKEVPENWNIMKHLPKGATVLVWAEEEDSIANKIRRSCLIEESTTDSLNEKVYTISQYRAYGPEFDEWYIPTVHRHPPKDFEGEADPRHYTIERKEVFNRQPIFQELQKVWSVGHYYFNMNSDFTQSTIGINWKMWMIYFNRYPSEKDYKEFR